MNTNNNTKISLGLLLISSLLLTSCSESFDESTVSNHKNVRETNVSLKEIQIKKIYKIKDKKSSELEAKLKQDKEKLADKSASELKTKKKSLLSETQNKIEQLMHQAQQDKTSVIISIEKEISTTATQTEDKLVEELLNSELKDVSTFLKNEKKIKKEYENQLNDASVKINAVEQKKLAILKEKVEDQRAYHKTITEAKANELENVRASTARFAKQKAINKIDMTISKLEDEYEEIVLMRIENVKKDLSDKKNTILSEIKNKYDSDKLQREKDNKDRLQNLVSKNKKIKQDVGDEKRSSLILVRKANLRDIEDELQASIEQAKTDEEQSLADIKDSLDLKLSNAVKNLEDIVIQKNQYLSEQAEQAEQRIIEEYNERKLVAEKNSK